MLSVHNISSRGRLIAILANPPLHPNTITERRISWAADFLRFDSFEIANMFPLASKSVLDIAAIGEDHETWLRGRKSLMSALTRADAVLLGYGCQEPTGKARVHHRDQANWLRNVIRERGLVTWMLGDRPHHPSRWQRHTSRHFPDLPFSEAVGRALRPNDVC